MNPNRRFKDEIFEQFSRIGKAIASPKRLELLDILCQGERTVEILARETGLTMANTSQYLQVLRAARLVEFEKKGLYAVYRPADPRVCDFFFPCAGLQKAESLRWSRLKPGFYKEKREGSPWTGTG